MAEFLPKLDVTLMIGVGAAFDFHSGRVKQAPRWMQRSGLEWFYRLCSEPRRLAKRYFRNNPLFALKFLGQLRAEKISRLLNAAARPGWFILANRGGRQSDSW